MKITGTVTGITVTTVKKIILMKITVTVTKITVKKIILMIITVTATKIASTMITAKMVINNGYWNLNKVILTLNNILNTNPHH